MIDGEQTARRAAFPPELNEELDRIYLILNALKTTAAPPRKAKNNGETTVVPNLVYGRSSSLIALASTSIPPSMVALESAPPGEEFEYLVSGPTQCRISDSETPTSGGIAWLSASNPGWVTATAPASDVRFFVGRFGSTRIVDGLIDVDAMIFPQSSQVL